MDNAVRHFATVSLSAGCKGHRLKIFLALGPRADLNVAICTRSGSCSTPEAMQYVSNDSFHSSTFSRRFPFRLKGSGKGMLLLMKTGAAGAPCCCAFGAGGFDISGTVFGMKAFPTVFRYQNRKNAALLPRFRGDIRLFPRNYKWRRLSFVRLLSDTMSKEKACGAERGRKLTDLFNKGELQDLLCGSRW